MVKWQNMVKDTFQGTCNGGTGKDKQDRAGQDMTGQGRDRDRGSI